MHVQVRGVLATLTYLPSIYAHVKGHSPQFAIFTCILSPSTKVRHLPRPWPLLRTDQSPDTVSARLAFHLHRLGLTGRTLIDAHPIISPQRAADLTLGRLPLQLSNVPGFAALIGVPAEELTRPLTNAEHAEWFFYRVSARHAASVWASARATWCLHDLSVRQAATAMDLHHSFVLRNSNPRARNISPLTLPPASRLTTALSTTYGPECFLPERYRDELSAWLLSSSPNDTGGDYNRHR